MGYGATPEEWLHLSLVLGLTPDLLPVVSNPTATISAESKMKGLGKTPSKYNFAGHVSGIAKWTERHSAPEEVSAWRQQPDYGICIQTRTVRALDIDIESGLRSTELQLAINSHLNMVLPCRQRSNSGKMLLAFTLEGEYTKRSFKTDGGIVEFLATGQQFIACGTHPSGVRYEWVNGLPDEFPTITAEQFESLWLFLVQRFAIEAPNERKATTKAATLAEAASADDIAAHLYAYGQVLSSERDGRLHIVCPFAATHTTDSAESATTYFPAHTGGYSRGHFRCLHAHCEARTDAEFLAAVGYRDDSGFAPVTETAAPVINLVDAPINSARFPLIRTREFRKVKVVDSLIHNVLPDADLVTVFGESGSGKTFIALDMMLAVAAGTPWRDRAVRQGACVYVAAEGQTGFRKRLSAALDARGIDTDDDTLPFGVIVNAPNFGLVADVRDVIASINAEFDGVRLVVVDTLAQVINGDENDGEDMGKVIAHCKAIREHTGATVMLIHHSGKNVAMGARGHSSLRGASDTMIEVTRCDDERVATIYKHKDLEGEGDAFGFRLNVVPVAVDSHGFPVTSCTVEHTVAAPKAQQKGKVGDVGAIVLRVLDGLVGLDGTGPDLEKLRVACVEQMAVPDGRDRRRDKVTQAIDALTGGGHIEQFAGGLRRVGGGDVQ